MERIICLKRLNCRKVDLERKKETFEEIALPHLGVVYRAAVAISGRVHVADDLTQTTFLKAFKQFSSFEAGTNCKAWLLRILRNTWIDCLRRQKFAEKPLASSEELVASVGQRETVWSSADDLIENFTDGQVIKALSELPEEQRLTLFLIDVEGFAKEQVAQITGVRVGTVKSRTSRARAALKEKLLSYAKERRLIRGEK